MIGSLRRPGIGGHEVVLLAQRIALRPHNATTLPALRRWYGDPEVARLSRHRNEPLTAAEVDQMVAQRISTAETLAFAIYERVGDAEWLVGMCALANLDTANASATYHLVIGEVAARGRGLGRAVTERIAAFAFDDLQLARLSLTVFAFNEAARRCYLAAGFTEEGRAREAIERNGKRWDEISMGLLAREWQGRTSI